MNSPEDRTVVHHLVANDVIINFAPILSDFVSKVVGEAASGK